MKQKNKTQSPTHIEGRIYKHYQYMCHHAGRVHDPEIPKKYLELNNTKTARILLGVFHSINEDHALAEIERQAYETANEIFLIHNPKPIK